MEKVNKQILAELQGLRQLLANQDAPASTASAPEASADSGMMTDYDCMLICTSDDVLAAIDRWNRSRRTAARGRRR